MKRGQGWPIFFKKKLMLKIYKKNQKIGAKPTRTKLAGTFLCPSEVVFVVMIRWLAVDCEASDNFSGLWQTG